MSAPIIFDLIKRIKELESEIENLKSKTLTQMVKTADTDLNDYIEDGTYYFSTSYTPLNIPSGSNGWLQVFSSNQLGVKQIWYRYGTANSNDFQTYVRTRTAANVWSDWKRFSIDS